MAEYVTKDAPPVLDDHECEALARADAVVDGEVKSRGYVARNFDAEPYGSIPFAAPYDQELIPRSEWRERIEEMDRTKMRLSDVRRLHKLPSTNQNGLGYCWIHGCVNAVRLMRAKHGYTNLCLEPTSAGALIKNYRNRGGNTPEAIRHLAQYGVAECKLWPANKLSKQYETSEMKENALRHRITEWWELRSNSFDHMATCLLRGFPVTIGLSWWGHMIVAMDLVAMSGSSYGVRIWNSWGDGWKENGESTLTERKGTAFDQFSLRAVTNYESAIA